VQQPCRLFDQEEVVLNASSTNEGRLVSIDKVRHARCEPSRQNLSEEAREAVDKANRSEVLEIHCSVLLREQGDESPIEITEELVPAKP
jgi:hypothetical protein